MPSMWIHQTRELLAIDLRTYGEDELAAKVSELTDDQMKQIGERAAEYACTGMLLARAVALAAIEFLEGRPREPKWKRRKLKGIYPGA